MNLFGKQNLGKMTLDEIAKLNANELPRYSVFAHDKLPLIGTKTHLADVLNRDLMITDFRIIKSKHRDGGECLQLQIVMDKTVYVLFTGSAVLIHQIRDAAERVPFVAQIAKVDKFFSFI